MDLPMTLRACRYGSSMLVQWREPRLRLGAARGHHNVHEEAETREETPAQHTTGHRDTFSTSKGTHEDASAFVEWYMAILKASRQ